MPMEVDSTRVSSWPRVGEKGDSCSDAQLGTALGLAETVAKRHGGEVRVRSCGDGGVLVELRFPIPAPPA
jgi:signal transduction histidine kinase